MKQDGEDYQAFIDRVAKNPLAVKAKLADLKVYKLVQFRYGHRM